MRKNQLLLCQLEFSALLIVVIAVTLVNGDPMSLKSSKEVFPEDISSELEKTAVEEVAIAKDHFLKDFGNSNDVTPFIFFSDKNPYYLGENQAPDSKLSLEKQEKNIEYGNKFEYNPPVTLADFGESESDYDPDRKYIGLGKRTQNHGTATKFLDLGKRPSTISKYDPALQFMGLGKRPSNYDPALKFMGLGKRPSSYDPALKFMGLGKRPSNYDPALKFMGLGKRASNYDPALKFMGLGKRPSNYDPAFKLMGLGKRPSNYDPAFKLMGLGKRPSNYDPAFKFMGLGKRPSNYDPAFKFMGLGKRPSNYDPALRLMGLGKRPSNYDPALKFMGLGKRPSSYDPALKFMGLGKRPSNYDPALKYMGLGKRSNLYNPALRFMRLGKRTIASNIDLKAVSLEKPAGIDGHNIHTEVFKRRDQYDPALKYMGLGKRGHKPTYDFSDHFSGLEKRNVDYLVSYPTSLDGVGDVLTQYSEANKNSEDNNTKFNDLGTLVGQRLSNKYISEDSIDELAKARGIRKRPYKLDPALQFMGLGKRFQQNSLVTEIDKHVNKFDPTLKSMRLDKRKYSDTTKSSTVNEDSSSYIFSDEEKSNDKIYHSNSDAENKSDDISFENKLNSSDEEQRMYDSNIMDRNFDKLTEKYDPSFLFMGPGKEGKMYDHQMNFKSLYDKGSSHDGLNTYADLSKHEKGEGIEDESRVDILELSKNSTATNGCEASCLMRRKRDMTSKPVIDGQNFEYEKKFSDILSTAKRERDRPRYNPGWIFIGLGKRDDAASEVTDEAKTDFENKEKFNLMLMDYYELLDKIKDKIKKRTINFDHVLHEFSPKSKKVHSIDPFSKMDEDTEHEHYSLQLPTNPSIASHALTWLDILPKIPWDKIKASWKLNSLEYK